MSAVEVSATEVPPQTPYTVVVGVSDTSRSPVALRWAVAQAERYDGRVVAVRAHRVAAAGPAVRPSGITRDESSEEASATEDLRADVAAVLGEDNDVVCVVSQGGRLKVLVRAAQGADLLVIDAPRATNLLAGPLFAHRLVYRADCPVVVMPPGISEEPPSWLQRAGRGLGAGFVRAAGTSGRAGSLMLPHRPDAAGEITRS